MVRAKHAKLPTGGDEIVKSVNFYGNNASRPALVLDKSKAEVLSTPGLHFAVHKRAETLVALPKRWRSAQHYHADALFARHASKYSTMKNKGDQKATYDAVLEDVRTQWRAGKLEKAEQERYEAMAAEDKDRYNQEVKAYNNAHPDDPLTIGKTGYAHRRTKKASMAASNGEGEEAKSSKKPKAVKPRKVYSERFMKISLSAAKQLKKMKKAAKRKKAQAVEEHYSSSDSESADDKEEDLAAALESADEMDEGDSATEISSDDEEDDLVEQAAKAKDDENAQPVQCPYAPKTRKGKKNTPPGKSQLQADNAIPAGRSTGAKRAKAADVSAASDHDDCDQGQDAAPKGKRATQARGAARAQPAAEENASEQKAADKVAGGHKLPAGPGHKIRSKGTKRAKLAEDVAANDQKPSDQGKKGSVATSGAAPTKRRKVGRKESAIEDAGQEHVDKACNMQLHSGAGENTGGEAACDKEGSQAASKAKPAVRRRKARKPLLEHAEPNTGPKEEETATMKASVNQQQIAAVTAGKVLAKRAKGARRSRRSNARAGSNLAGDGAIAAQRIETEYSGEYEPEGEDDLCSA